MGFFDALFGINNTSRKITSKEFKNSLKAIKSLTWQERSFLEGAFANELKDGTINIDELKKEIAELKANKKDMLGDGDVQRIKEKLSGIIVSKWEKL